MNVELSQPESLTKLKQLLQVNHDTFKITFNPLYFSNHLVHALCSLYYSGASPKQLQDFFDFYTNKLEPLPEPKFKITRDNWLEYFGSRDNYAEYLEFYQNEINEHGMVETFKEYFPKLIAGLAGAALHPLIHTGYAVEFQLPQVMAEGLAYACIFYLPVGELIDKLPAASEQKSISSLIDQASKLDVGKFQKNKLSAKINGIVESHGHLLPSLISQWNLTEDESIIKERLDELTRESIRVYGNSTHNNRFDFFLLHQVTGNHAVRTIIPLLPLDQQIRLLRINLVSLMVLFLTQGAPSLDSNRILKYQSTSFNQLTNWKDLLHKTTYHKDEHLIKVIRNIYQFNSENGNNEDSDYYFKLAIKSWDSMQADGDWYFQGIGFFQRSANL